MTSRRKIISLRSKPNILVALASQWIPADRALWKIENYRAFLDVRQALLASETNKRLAELLHGDTRWLEGLTKSAEAKSAMRVAGGITSEAEEAELLALNEWVDGMASRVGYCRRIIRRRIQVSNRPSSILLGRAVFRKN